MINFTELKESLNIPDHKTHVSVSAEEGEYLYELIKNNHLKDTLEVGLAYGYSATCILSAKSEGKHVAIDPYQKSAFNNCAIESISTNLPDSDFKCIYELSEVALPGLLKEKLELDMAFIDGGHLYDQIMLDFYYIDKMLKVNGVVVFHDAWMRSTCLIASFIKNNKKSYKKIKSPKNLFAFRKTDREDNRKWNHFKEFYTIRGLISDLYINKVKIPRMNKSNKK